MACIKHNHLVAPSWPIKLVCIYIKACPSSVSQRMARQVLWSTF